jgi:hypothetical protein
MMKRIWILGAPDPEMELIEHILRRAEEDVAYATIAGARVRADDAYLADGARRRPWDADVPVSSSPMILVECAFTSPPRGDEGEIVVIDHHRPGDPGYGRPPAEYLSASSIGQVASLLWRCSLCGAVLDLHDRSGPDGDPIRGFDSTIDLWPDHRPSRALADEIMLAAAADHCLAAAYRGECPGVEPDALMRWRAYSRARFQKRPVGAVLVDIERARAALREAPELVLGPGITARNMIGQKVAELPEASAREGLCFVSEGLPSPDGRAKVVCQSGSPEQIRAFMDAWAPAHGLVDIYGDPARGFAGGYMRDLRSGG